MPLLPASFATQRMMLRQPAATLLMVPLIVDKDSNRCFCFLHKKKLWMQQ
jgi:hypothetical protein